MATSGSTNEAAMEANKDGYGQPQTTISDEDPNDKVVDERYAIAEVMLPSTVCESYPLSVFV